MIKQTLLMTGASGLVGSRFVELYGNAYQISNLDLTTGVDITDPRCVESFITAHPAKHLIHLAAFTDTAAAQAQQGDQNGPCYRVNVLGTRHLATICQKQNIHLIHVSTDFVFDGQKTTPYTEDDPVSPLGWYGTTKALAESEVKQSGAPATIVRISYPYRRNFDLKPDLVKKIIEGLQSHTLSPQFDDTLITPTYVDDIARAFDTVIQHNARGIYHLVGSTILSPYDLAVQIATRLKLDPAVVVRGSLTDFLKSSARTLARNSGLSNAKATLELDVHFATIADGLAAVI